MGSDMTLQVPNSKYEVHFLRTDFGGGGWFLVTCRWEKTMSTPCPTDMNCTVRLHWNSTKTNALKELITVNGEKDISKHYTDTSPDKQGRT